MLSDVELVGVIQMIVQESIQAMKLTDKATGTVLSTAPLSVRTDMSMQAIPAAALLITDPVRGELAAGDRVLMLRVQNGQQYIILSKIQ